MSQRCIEFKCFSNVTVSTDTLFSPMKLKVICLGISSETFPINAIERIKLNEELYIRNHSEFGEFKVNTLI